MGIVILAGSSAAVNAILIAVSRMMGVMAAEGLLPPFLAIGKNQASAARSPVPHRLFFILVVIPGLVAMLSALVGVLLLEVEWEPIVRAVAILLAIGLTFVSFWITYSKKSLNRKKPRWTTRGDFGPWRRAAFSAIRYTNYRPSPGFLQSREVRIFRAETTQKKRRTGE